MYKEKISFLADISNIFVLLISIADFILNNIK